MYIFHVCICSQRSFTGDACAWLPNGGPDMINRIHFDIDIDCFYYVYV